MIWLLMSACSLHSGLNIENGASFALGENRHGPFRAAVVNDGAQPVSVFARSDGELTSVGELAPGQRAELRFGAGETAIFQNTGEDTAHLDVRVRGDTELSMGYEAN